LNPPRANPTAFVSWWPTSCILFGGDTDVVTQFDFGGGMGDIIPLITGNGSVSSYTKMYVTLAGSIVCHCFLLNRPYVFCLFPFFILFVLDTIF
jgi:hypothetical protein